MVEGSADYKRIWLDTMVGFVEQEENHVASFA